MLIVGLTGGIACGKTTVSKRLEEKHGLTIVDADKIAREVVEPNRSAYKRIVKHFLPLIPTLLNEDGTLNRRELGSFVFGNKAELAVLNSIVHPAVRWAMVWLVLKAYLTGKRMVILDVPLLFESKLDQFCGTTVLVACEEELQVIRLLKRDPDLSKLAAEDRINSQMPTKLKVEKADVVIYNNTTIQDLNEQIDGVVAEITPSLVKTAVNAVFGLFVAGWIYTRRRFQYKEKKD